MAYGLLQLLSVRLGQLARSIINQPWRSRDTVTAGMIRTGLSELIAQFNIRSCCARKSEIFQFSDIENIPDPEEPMLKAA